MPLLKSRKLREYRKQFRMAIRACKRGDLDAAEAAFEAALQVARSPEIPSRSLATTLYHAGSLHLLLAEYRNAEKTLLEARALLPSDIPGIEIAERLHALRIETQESRESPVLREERQRLADTFVGTMPFLRTMPRRSGLLNNLAISLRHAGETKWALAILGLALEADKNNPAFLGNLGNVLTQDGRYAEAVSILRRSLELRPGHPPTLSNLGYALRMSDQLDEASSVLGQSLLLRPDHPQTMNNLALTYVAQGQAGEASRLFETISDAGTGHMCAYARLALGEVVSHEDILGDDTGSVAQQELRQNLQLIRRFERDNTVRLRELDRHIRLLPPWRLKFMRPSALLTYVERFRLANAST